MLAKKSKSKKPASRKTSTIAEPVSPYREKKSVRITQADNGFTVSCYGPKGEEIKIATSLTQAARHAKAMMDDK
jgi:hypothetical protein